MRVISVNIGKKKTVTWNGRKIETGIFKYPVEGAILLDRENVKEDTIIDRKYHGGIDQAVYGYSEGHYHYWKEKYPHLEWQYGMFGENLTISELNEDEIQVGDQYQLGEAILEVTKPREPCMKLGIRFGTQKVLKQFWNSTKSGIYFKVLQTGRVAVNDELLLINKSKDSKTIAAIFLAKKEKQKGFALANPSK